MPLYSLQHKQQTPKGDTVTPIELLEKGFYLFPVKEKIPKIQWTRFSSNDPDQIAKWSTEFPNCDWGVDLGKSNLCVLDDDSGKNPAGADTMLGLELTHGPLPETFTVSTLNNGRHYYFKGDIANTQGSKNGHPGVDTKGAGGYVVSPCAKGYKIITDHPITPAPEWFSPTFGRHAPKTDKSPPPVIDLDKDGAISRATHYLQQEDPAIEGCGGDAHTYQVACRIKDYGVSREVALSLMLDYFNDRCSPPWEINDLEQKVRNAYNYGALPPGVSSPEAAFNAAEANIVDVVEISKSLFIDANDLINRPMAINYLVSNLIESPATGLIFGPSTAGKSFLAIDLSYAVATGTTWLAEPAKRGSVFYLAGEGQGGFPRRLKAWSTYHNITSEQGFLSISRSRIDFTPESAKKIAGEIQSMAERTGPPSLIIIDTLARHLVGDENSAKEVGEFINMVDSLKNQFRCVVIIIHHSGKGNQEYSRGSSVIRAAMDFEIKIAEGAIIFTKQKDGELPHPKGFELIDVDLGEGVKSAVPVLKKYVAPGTSSKWAEYTTMAYSILSFEIDTKEANSIEEKVWRDIFIKSQPDETRLETCERRFRRAKETLLKENKIQYAGSQVSIIGFSEVKDVQN